MKKIKIFALLLLSLLAAQGAMAQKRTVSSTVIDGETVTTIVKRMPEFTPKHDIRIGIGSVSVPSYFLLDDGNWGYDGSYWFHDEMKYADTYKTSRYFVGNYSLSYTYQDRRWLQYGATLVFGASTRQRKDSFTGKTVENLNHYSLTLMPTVRFNWFYRECVQLYSSASLAFVTDFDSGFLWGDATLLGCSFGRNFFGFAEFGLGMSGWARAGVGYRFNAVKKQK